MFGFDFRHGQGMPAAAAADMDAEFARERRESAFERADHARGMPVHPHHGAEGLKPERMGETAQEFVAAVIMRDGLGDYRAQPCHALAEPCRNPAVVKRQIGAT
jgi:hypothetical protein